MLKSNPSNRYDATTIRLHWAIAIFVALQWLGAELIDYVPGRPAHQFYWSMHIVIGLIFAVLVVTHIWWRRRHGAKLPVSTEEGWRTATQVMHGALNVLPVFMVLLGFSIIAARGWNLFHVVQIPAVPGGSKHLAHTITGIHEWTAHALVFLGVGHAGAALFHHFRLRDGVLARMIPSLSVRLPAGTEIE